MVRGMLTGAGGEGGGRGVLRAAGCLCDSCRLGETEAGTQRQPANIDTTVILWMVSFRTGSSSPSSLARYSLHVCLVTCGKYEAECEC